MNMQTVLAVLVLCAAAISAQGENPHVPSDTWTSVTPIDADTSVQVACGNPTDKVVAKIAVTNNVKTDTKVDVCKSEKKGSCLTCLDDLPLGTDAVVTVYGENAFLLFAFKGPKAGSDRELYRDPHTGKWPSEWTLTDDVTFESVVEASTAKHFIHPTEPHCEDVSATSDGVSSDWWKANGWRYTKWSLGKCPIKFNFVNQVDHPVSGVTHRTMGVKTKKQQLAVSFAVEQTLVTHSVEPGSAHCYEMAFAGGKDNEYYKSHGYQYAPPIWTAGRCPSKFNWFNRKITIAAGVTETTKGVNTVMANEVMMLRPGASVAKHLVYTSAPHCEDVVADTASTWYKANSWKYEKWNDGKCPSRFDFLNEEDHPATGVVHRTLGVKGAPQFVETVVPLESDPIPCGGTGGKVLLTNKLRPSIKLRMCTEKVDPKTGWACNHGTPFIDCDRRVNMGEVAELDVSSNVETVLPVTFTAQGAVDMVSNCYWKKPAGGWPKSSVDIDQAWWDNLQKSC